MPRFTVMNQAKLAEALNTLEGLLQGIAADSVIHEKEVSHLKEWLDTHNEFQDHQPLKTVRMRTEMVLADGKLDEKEKSDMLELCERFTRPNQFITGLISDLQRLSGIVQGIAADGMAKKGELDELKAWADEHPHLSGYWPYDELQDLINQVLADGKIDPLEQRVVLAFFSEMLKSSAHLAVQ